MPSLVFRLDARCTIARRGLLCAELSRDGRKLLVLMHFGNSQSDSFRGTAT